MDVQPLQTNLLPATGAVLGIPCTACPNCTPSCDILQLQCRSLTLNVYRDMAKVKDLLLPTLSITGDMYPETLAHLVVTRAPGFFDAAFSAIRRMLPPDTQAKIQASACSLRSSWIGCRDGFLPQRASQGQQASFPWGRTRI